MPVKSSSSFILRWPDASAVGTAARRWARRQMRERPELLRLGLFGSYARGDAGVGSDLDFVAVVRESVTPFIRRAVEWDLAELPVPADILIYTEAEWTRLCTRGARLTQEMVWLVERSTD